MLFRSQTADFRISPRHNQASTAISTGFSPARCSNTEQTFAPTWWQSSTASAHGKSAALDFANAGTWPDRIRYPVGGFEQFRGGLFDHSGPFRRPLNNTPQRLVTSRLDLRIWKRCEHLSPKFLALSFALFKCQLVCYTPCCDLLEPLLR